MPASLNAIALPNRIAAWQRAIKQALGDLPNTLELGKRTRDACLALPSIEDTPPGWADAAPEAAADQRAAE
jgi:hypothetical protein